MEPLVQNNAEIFDIWISHGVEQDRLEVKLSF